MCYNRHMTETEAIYLPRPQRCRRVCCEPEYARFLPEGTPGSGAVQLSIDEFEVLRIVDYERRTHEQCAAQMDISRTTVTEIYERARHKLADVLVNGKRLEIAGGSYRLCDGSAGRCCGKTCFKAGAMPAAIEKGEDSMRIAVTYENGEIFQHFGHSQQFKIYDVEDGKILRSEVIDTNGSGHGALAGFLVVQKVDELICGGIGGGAQAALSRMGIKLYGGVSGSADAAVQALIEGRLDYNPDVQCSHHDHAYGEGAHSCGEHGCGGHGDGHNCGEHGCH